MNCKVSVITVVRNGVNTIEKTIKSVLGQTYKNIEYIVIDGASTDGTKQIIEKYLDDIAVYISEEDKGLYCAMNKGIEIATGEIIGIINSDDWYDINAVATVVQCFKHQGADVVHGRVNLVSEDGSEKISWIPVLDHLWYQMDVWHPTVFVKKDIYQKYGAFDVSYKLAADYEFILRLYSDNVKISFVDETIAYFRVGGLSWQKFMDSINESYRISMVYLDKCPHKDIVQHKIKEKYNQRYWAEKTLKVKGKFFDLLCKYFNTKVDHLVIFGAGMWGERCCHALVDSGVNILYFVDNDANRWNTKFCGIEIIAPCKLKEMETYVLIANEDHGEEIKEQISNMENDRLNCVMIKDFWKLEQIF